jgi:transposase-like protein
MLAFSALALGMSRPALRKWWRRFHQNGEAGSEDLSRRHYNCPQQKVFEQEAELDFGTAKTATLLIHSCR